MALRSLCLFSQSRNIYVVTARSNFSYFSEYIESAMEPGSPAKGRGSPVPVFLLDEDQLIENIDLAAICTILRERSGYDLRAGWFYQQFLKMSVCDLVGVAEHYLIWDADTVLIKMDALCQSLKEHCDKLIHEFEELNEDIKQKMRDG